MKDKMEETVDERAVKIAAMVMRAAGFCRYDSVEKCRRLYVDETICDKCIEEWLRTMARKELEREHCP